MIGVLRSASCFMTADMHADIGVEHISEGKEAVRGVWSGGRTGLVMAVGDMSSERWYGCRQRVSRQPSSDGGKDEVVLTGDNRCA